MPICLPLQIQVIFVVQVLFIPCNTFTEVLFFFPLKKSRSKSILQVDIYILGKNIPRRLNILLGVQIKVTSIVVERAEHTFTPTLTTPVR